MQIRWDCKLEEPVGENSKPAERYSSLMTLDSLLGSRKVKRNVQSISYRDLWSRELPS